MPLPSPVIRGILNRMMRHPSAAGSNNSYKYGALVKILKLISFRIDDLLFDIGCGFGIPCFLACLQFNVKSVGIDKGEYEYKFCVAEMARLTPQRRGMLSFEHLDVMHLPALPPNVTVVYMFDAVFTSDVCTKIRTLLVKSTTWRVLCTCKSVKYLQEYLHEEDTFPPITFPPIALVGSVSGSLRGTNCSRTMYVYSRI